MRIIQRLREDRTVWAIIIVSGIVFLLDVISGSRLTLFGAKSSAIWTHHQYYRLLTATFLHGSLMHIVFNMYALSIFGQVTRRLLSAGRFLVVYLLSGAFGYISSLLFSPDIPAVGASASIFGLMGFMLHFRLRRLPLRWSPVDTAFLQIFGLNILVAVFVPNIDHWAHAGGLLGGIICGSLVGIQQRHPLHPLPPRTGWSLERWGAIVLTSLFFIGGLQPHMIARAVQPLSASAADRVTQRYTRFFMPYVMTSPEIVWRYTDTEGDWVPVRENNVIDVNRPVALAIFWRWEAGAAFRPGLVNDYDVIWYHQDNIVHRDYHMVYQVDTDHELIYLRSMYPAEPGEFLLGTWHIHVEQQGVAVYETSVELVN